jgi:hypothetical protein
MKSKVYIISEIRKLLEQNRGFCEEEFKGDLMKGKQYRDVSCMSWFREEEQ